MTNRSEPGRTTDYGFEWGPVEVTRVLNHRGTRVLFIKSATGVALQISVSPTGRSVRVFKGTRELT